MYIPYFLAKTLKEHFEQPCVDVDVIGMISLTENYMCFKRKESRFGSKKELLEFLYDKIDGNVLKIEKKDMTDLHIDHYLGSREKTYKKLKKNGDLPPRSTNPASLSEILFRKQFDFGIKPIALWLTKEESS